MDTLLATKRTSSDHAWKGVFLSAVLTLLLSVCVLGATSQAAWAAGGTIQGSGTEADPYLIEDADDLTAMTTYTWGSSDSTHLNKYWKLTADIDGFQPTQSIGHGSSNYFTGTFDGDGHTVKVSYTSTSTSAYSVKFFGLFGYAGYSSTNNATIKNLTVDNNVSKKTQYLGGIAGYAKYATFENCHVTGSLAGTTNIGGIVGYSEYLKGVSACGNAASISGTSSYVGGIVGQAKYGIVATDCSNSGSVTSSSYGVGGIVGYAMKSNASSYQQTIKNCVNTGAITGKSGSSSYYGVAGIAGGMYNGYGLEASNKTDTSISYIENCYTSGQVTNESTSTDRSGAFVAGLYNTSGTTYQKAIVIKNSYYESGSANAATPSAITYDAFVYQDSTGATVDASATVKTAAQLQDPAFVTTLNNSQKVTYNDKEMDVWNKGNDDSNNYPILYWQVSYSNGQAVIDTNPAKKLTWVEGTTPTPVLTVVAHPYGITDGSVTLNYQWQECDTEKGTYTNIEGASGSMTANADGTFTATYNPSTTLPAGQDHTTTYYQVVITSAKGGVVDTTIPSTTSNPASEVQIWSNTVKAKALSATPLSDDEKTKTVDQTAAGETTTLGATAAWATDATGTEGSVTAQWYAAEVTDGTAGTPAAVGKPQALTAAEDGAFTATYAVDTNELGTKEFYCVFSNALYDGATGDALATAQSGTITFTVQPLTITDQATYQAFADKVNGANGNTKDNFAGRTVVLGNDITISGSFTPAGRYYYYQASSNICFDGTFDGQGHSVTFDNATYASSGSEYNVGGVIGNLGAGSSTTAAVKNLTVKGQVTYTFGGTYASGHWAGVVGYSNYGTIENVVNEATVVGSTYAKNVGGVVGYAGSSKLTQVGNSGGVSSEASSSAVGGVAGMTSGSKLTTLDQCYNRGAISSTGTSSYAGGLVGQTSSYNPAISNSYNTGTVTGGNYAGGVMGNSANATSGSFTNIYETGAVTGGSNKASATYTGKAPTPTNCYFLKSVAQGQEAEEGYTQLEQLDLLKDSFVATITGTLAEGSTSVWASDDWYVNAGMPVLAWENSHAAAQDAANTSTTATDHELHFTTNAASLYQPVSTTAGSTAALKVVADQGGAAPEDAAYTWYEYKDGAATKVVEGAAGGVLTIDTTKNTEGNKIYYCVVAGKDASGADTAITSAYATVNIYAAAEAPTNVVMTYAGQTVENGGSVAMKQNGDRTLKVVATSPDGGTLTYSWQAYDEEAGAWKAIDGATGAMTAGEDGTYSATYTVPAQPLGESQFQCIVTNTVATATNISTATSGPVTVTMEGATISNADELVAFAADVNDGNNYKDMTVSLTGDIDMAGKEFAPIGDTTAHAFQGTFDGAGYSIKNLTCNITSGSIPAALFGYAGVAQGGATIENLVIDSSCTFTSSVSDAAGVVGQAIGVTFKNVGNNATVTSTKTENNSYGNAGGIVASIPSGYASGGGVKVILEGCYNKGTVTAASYGYSGGLVGYDYRSGLVIKDCYSTGSVNSGYNGGLVGHTNRYSSSEKYERTITNAYVAGSIQGGNFGGAILGCDYTMTGFTFTATNVYYDTATSTVIAAGGSVASVDGITAKTDEETKALATTLGSAFRDDLTGEAAINKGYPVLKWETLINIKDATVIVDAPEGGFTYTGKAQEPTVTVKLGDTTLVKDTDYTLSYDNNTNAGTATITITGTGNYAGTVKQTFTIAAAGVDVPTATAGLTYTGQEQTGVKSAEGAPYTLTGNTGTEVGTYKATATLTDTKNYVWKTDPATTDDQTIEWSIAAADAASATVSVTTPEGGFTYTGKAQEPDVVVKIGDTTLTKGTDYEVAYENNTNAGTATVKVTFKGNYTGEATQTFEIAKATPEVSAPADVKATYGDALSSVALPEGFAWNDGTQAVGDVGKHNFKATYTPADATNYNTVELDVEVTVEAANVASATVIVDAPEGGFTYTGKAQEPTVTVKLGDTTLVKDTDYTLSYENNTNAGTATITITGTGNCTGTATATFEIAKAPVTITVNDAEINEGEALPEFTGTVEGIVDDTDLGVKYALAEGADYTKPGAYAIQATYTENANYSVEVVEGTLTVKEVSKVVRLAGEDRYATMDAIVSEGFEQSDVAILATGANFPDALAASALAGVNNAPIVLTTGDKLGAEAKAELQRLGAKTVYVLGGNSAISSSVFEQVAALGCKVQRIHGDSRQDTSIAVYNQVIAQNTACDTVIIASGKGFADALSISPYSYTTGTPILLTDDDGNLTEAELAAIKANANIKNAIIVGGEGVVSNSTFEELHSAHYKVTRLKGNDRYETSAAIATWELSHGLSAERAAIATGTNFPDALAGAALSGAKGSILLLADDSNYAQATGALAANTGKVMTLYVYGGTGVVSDTVKDACASAAGIPAERV